MLLRAVHKYSEDEPRDDSGKWTDGGGDGGGDGVSADEASALHHYQGTYHTAGGEVNGYMRHPAELDDAAKKNPALQKLVTSYKTEANAINDALDKSKLKESSTLWRVLGQTYGKKLLRDGPKLVGKDLPAVGFQSTSKSKEFDKVADKMPVRLKITAPKGAHALDIDNLKGFNKDYQHEILLGEGHYHVDKWVKEKGTAQGILEVSYVEGPKRKF
jgi:hypothetical protein